jgi:hypothetical protein
MGDNSGGREVNPYQNSLAQRLTFDTSVPEQEATAAQGSQQAAPLAGVNMAALTQMMQNIAMVAVAQQNKMLEQGGPKLALPSTASNSSTPSQADRAGASTAVEFGQNF